LLIVFQNSVCIVVGFSGEGYTLFSSVWCVAMGLSRWFYVESKSFKFDREVGVPVLRIFESRSYMRSVSLGKASILWLLAVMEEVLNTGWPRNFLRKTEQARKFSLVSEMRTEVAVFWSLANMAEEGGMTPLSFQRGEIRMVGLAGCPNCASLQHLFP
jgi:hypothetical protein